MDRDASQWSSSPSPTRLRALTLPHGRPSLAIDPAKGVMGVGYFLLVSPHHAGKAHLKYDHGGNRHDLDIRWCSSPRSQRVVHLRVRCSVRARVNLWFPARGLALRSSRSYLGARCASPMATQGETFKHVLIAPSERRGLVSKAPPLFDREGRPAVRRHTVTTHLPPSRRS
jgi:hypothetical protein